MKRKITLPVCFLITLLLVCTLQSSAFHYTIYQPKDTTAKASADLLKAKQGLLKTIGNAFKFRANAQKREKERVLNIIKGLSIGDSIRLSADNLKEMINALGERQDAHYDSIMVLIDSLKNKFPLTVNIHDITHTTPPDTTESVEDSTGTDIDITEILNKLLPPPGKQLTEKEETDRSNKFVIVTQLLDSGKLIRQTTEGTNHKEYQLSLRKRTAFYGFYNAKAPYASNNVPFHFFNWWVYDALYFNGITGRATSLNRLQSPNIIDTARLNNCNIAYSIQLANPSTTSAFLKNKLACQALTSNVIAFLDKQPANAINVHLTNTTPKDKDNYTAFIRVLSKGLKNVQPTPLLFLTFSEDKADTKLNLLALDTLCDKFIISDSAAIPYFIANKIASSRLVYAIPVKDSVAIDRPALSGKLGLITDYNLEGAAIVYTSTSQDYMNAWKEILYKLTTIDTVLTKDTTIVIRTPNLSFFDKIYRRLCLYNFIINNPCAECFEGSIKDSAYDSSNHYLQQYMYDLYIDTLAAVYNVRKLEKAHTLNEAVLKYILLSDFDYLIKELTNILFALSLFTLLGCIVLGIVYVLNLKNKGDEWNYKKTVARLLIVFTALLTLFTFSYVFVNDQIPLFGVDGDTRMGNEKIAANHTTITLAACMPDKDCINISLYTLLGIITLGAAVGVLTARFLILPLLKHDVP